MVKHEKNNLNKNLVQKRSGKQESVADVNYPGQEERKCSFLKGDPVPQDEGWEILAFWEEHPVHSLCSQSTATSLLDLGAKYPSLRLSSFHTKFCLHGFNSNQLL